MPFHCTPRRTLAVSVTGDACSLHCNHCNAHYLQHMMPVAAARMLLETDSGYTSILLSGGSDAEGRVPLAEHLEFIRWVRQRGIRINAHVGLQKEEEILQLAPYFDRVSLDYVWEDATIREVYHTRRSGADYLHAAGSWINAFKQGNRPEDLIAAKKRVGLHLTIGLRGGRLSGEKGAIDSLIAVQPVALIFLVLIPTKGTVYSDVPVVPLEDVESVFAYARRMLPATDFVLGCMHPRVNGYGEQLARLAERYGFRGLVGETATGAEGENIDECCAFYH